MKELNCATVRHHMALVEQEPRLFDRTITENITYGSHFKEGDMQQVIDAATRANIHSFILTLSEVQFYLFLCF